MFWFALIVLAIAACAVLAALFARNSDTRGGAVLTAIGASVLGSILIVVASVSQVPTRNVGIVTEFSKATGRTTGAGIQWHAPWQGIDDWDASGQTYAHLGDNCVTVKIAAQRTACIPVQVEWASNAERAPENWAAYREVDGIDGGRFGTFVARRVNPQMDAAMTSVFASFDPLGTVDVESGKAPAPDLNKTYKQPLQAALTTALGGDVTIRSISFGAPRYDDATSKAIEAYGQKILEGRNLAIDEANAEVRKRIAGESGLTPFQKACLDQAGAYAGLCAGGQGSQVILPAK